MESNVYSDPAHNLGCQKRFTCGAVKCPDSYESLRDHDCYVDRFSRYQPSNEVWYRKDWDDVRKITWWEVFGLKEKWLYIIYIIIISVFISMLMVLAKVLLIYRYY
ncbi:Uncharacterised protein [uncultured archaeon]|nr:Uncharacterised protein [uncultured archaeon]